MRTRNLTILIVLAAGLAAGCGADDETKPSIPAETTAALDSRLSEIQRRFEFGGGACSDIADDSQPAVESILDTLPDSVDPDVRSALVDSFNRLFQLTSEQCDEAEGQETEPDTTATTETTETTETTDTTETEPPTTDTTETETTPTETIPTETVPPEGDGDSGDGAEAGGGVGPGS